MTGDLCGWEEQVEQGEGDQGVVRASKSNLPGHPLMDFNPGTVNGKKQVWANYNHSHN